MGQKFNSQTQHNIRFTDVVSFVYIYKAGKLST